MKSILKSRTTVEVEVGEYRLTGVRVDDGRWKWSLHRKFWWVCLASLCRDLYYDEIAFFLRFFAKDKDAASTLLTLIAGIETIV